MSLEDIFIHIHKLAQLELGILREMFVQMDSMADAFPALHHSPYLL